MTIKEILDIAEKGGFPNIENAFYHIGMSTKYPAIFLNPEFWQCLGKSMEWKEYHVKHRESECGEYCRGEWLYQWHCFIDHISKNRDPQSFFDQFKI